MRHFEEPLYRSCRALQRHLASRPDATHIRFVLDHQARERAEPGTDRDEIARLSPPPHLGLEDAYTWAHWDLPMRAMIEALSIRYPEVGESRATMPMLASEFWFESHARVNADYQSAENHLQRYLTLIRPLGEAEPATARIFAEQVDPDDAAWVLLTLRETRYWLVHLLQSVTTRLMPTEYLLRNTGKEN